MKPQSNSCLRGAQQFRCQKTKSGGSSLIEVMLAVAVMAVMALGLIAGQLWTARDARAMSMREHAAWIADSVAEAVSAPSPGDAALKQWSSKASMLLLRGEASVVGAGAVSVARLTWAALRNLPRADGAIDKPESCGTVDASVGLARGHTLIEFVIAMALGLVVTAAAVSLYTAQRTAIEHASNALRIREAGLTAQYKPPQAAVCFCGDEPR